ncbi:coiled-coil domain-containing protein [Nonomuraea sp. NPDC049309]|uniref:coiled-coil domain-containing protein n=1 Tax=Nonomuraea sp. NPDC049309 TaxID=3364350 RepID=UPI0037147867
MVTTLTAAAALLAAAPPAVADPKPSADQLLTQLRRLQKEFDATAADYNASQVALAAARRREQAAADRLKRAQQEYDDSRRQIVQLVQLSYQSPPASQSLLMGAGEPDDMLRAAAILQAQARERTAVIDRYAAARDARRQAQQEAEASTRQLRDRSSGLREQRERADKLIAAITDRLDRLIVAPGTRRPDGSWVPELPGGPDNITPRTRLLRDQARQRFQLPYGIGCYRSLQDGGEHPQGRACDFMISRGGTWPTASQVAVGDELAAWAIRNASRLGVKYVIYQRRIWQSGAWKAMSDRGGITANHEDHVHISMQ